MTFRRTRAESALRRVENVLPPSVPMHYLAPFPIIIGVFGLLVGILWLVAAGSEEDGGPNAGLFWLFGSWYIGLRVAKQLGRDPMSVLPAFGILIGSALLIWLGIVML